MIPNREVIFTVKRANSRILLHLKPKAAPINRRPFVSGKNPSGQILIMYRANGPTDGSQRTGMSGKKTELWQSGKTKAYSEFLLVSFHRHLTS